MNKAELIDAIASTTGLSKADAGRALGATTDALHQLWRMVMVYRLQALVVLWLEIEQHALVVTHKRALRFKSRLLKLQRLKQVKH